MKKIKHLFAAKPLLYHLFFAAVLAYHILAYGAFSGLYVTLLLWSTYILCLPGAHGRTIIGYPLSFITTKTASLEIYVWGSALLFSILTYFITSYMYDTTLVLYLARRIIFTPQSYGLILIVSAIGTLYYPMLNLTPTQFIPAKHRMVRFLIVVLGILTFLYLAHYDIIVFINALT